MIKVQRHCIVSVYISNLELRRYILFAFLFCSEKFQNYIGTLVMAIAASVEESEKVTLEYIRMCCICRTMMVFALASQDEVVLEVIVGLTGILT